MGLGAWGMGLRAWGMEKRAWGMGQRRGSKKLKMTFIKDSSR
jgi:hypothetical protein